MYIYMRRAAACVEVENIDVTIVWPAFVPVDYDMVHPYAWITRENSVCNFTPVLCIRVALLYSEPLSRCITTHVSTLVIWS